MPPFVVCGYESAKILQRYFPCVSFTMTLYFVKANTGARGFRLYDLRIFSFSKYISTIRKLAIKCLTVEIWDWIRLFCISDKVSIAVRKIKCIVLILHQKSILHQNVHIHDDSIVCINFNVFLLITIFV